jgi:hypothetical protein
MPGTQTKRRDPPSLPNIAKKNECRAYMKLETSRIEDKREHISDIIPRREETQISSVDTTFGPARQRTPH